MNIYAHKKENKGNILYETLKEHQEKTLYYFNKIFNIEYVIDFINIKNKKIIKSLIIDSIKEHDYGKNKPEFQYKKMDNIEFKNLIDPAKDSKHSMEGAKFLFLKYIKEIESIEDDIEYYNTLYFLLILCFNIAKHHSNLTNFEEFLSKFYVYLLNEDINEYEYIFTQMDFLEQNTLGFDIYIIAKLLYSVLVASDYYATFSFFSEQEVNDFGYLKDYSILEQHNIIKNIRNNIATNELNQIRNQMFLESEQNLLKNIDNNIFYLNAPTGAGKTLMSLNLALKTKPKKIFYIFPFNTLIEQTSFTFQEFLGDSIKYTTINSLGIDIEDDEQSQDYEKIYIERFFYHYPIILTSHVNFFNILFGTTKESNFPLWQLQNSTIVLDEIQSYNPKLWQYMVYFFNSFAKVLNLKIIIMSATLPKVDNLLNFKSNFIDLLDSGYLKHPLFANRVSINLELLKQPFEFKNIIEIIKQEKANKILIEFIKIQDAKDFFNYIKQNIAEYQIAMLTSEDNRAYRYEVIEQCKKDIKLILITTQLIEAGVDIDMDLGFKDISLIESEEQFLGRINRNGQKTGKAYFFNYTNTLNIYRNDVRKQFDIFIFKDILLNKSFNIYYQQLMELLKKQGDNTEFLFKRIDIFQKEVNQLKYLSIKKNMTLIEEQNYKINVFFPIQIDITNNIKKYLQINNEFITNNKIDGYKVWNKFIEINKSINYLYKKIELLKIKSYLELFTYKINKKFINYYDDNMGDIFFIKNYDFFLDEKLKLKSFSQSNLFL